MKRILEFDGLRAVAVILVIAFHASGLRFRGGYIGVDVFFVLSGFLITTLLVEEFSKSGRVSFRNFYARRILRLAPALLVVLLASCLVGALSPDPEQALRAAAAALFYAMNWVLAFNLFSEEHLGHTWSLAVEEQFYLVWPILLVSCLWFANRRSAFYLALALVIACATWRAALAMEGAPWARTYYGFDTRADSLFVGCALALCNSKGLARMAARSWVIPVLALGLIIASATLQSRWMHLGGLTVTAVASAWIICALTSERRGLLSAILGNPIAVYLGRISYGMYLWHAFLAHILQTEGVDYHYVLILIVPATLALASLSFFLIERPYLRLKTRWSPVAAPEGEIRASPTISEETCRRVAGHDKASETVWEFASAGEEVPLRSGAMRMAQRSPSGQ